MIEFDGVKFEFINMGLFESEEQWIHPKISVVTYEIIFVMEGEVFIFEGEKNYHLQKGECLILTPNIMHGGYKVSQLNTQFYWLHFNCENYNNLNINKYFNKNLINLVGFRFKEIQQMEKMKDSKLQADLLSLNLLLTLKNIESIDSEKKLVYEIAEWIRINSEKNLSVKTIANKYNYNSDTLSKKFKVVFGINLKAFINLEKISYIKNYLVNTNKSIKEIAYISGFEDENLFVKFFKYNMKISPSNYRNNFFHIHKNKK